MVTLKGEPTNVVRPIEGGVVPWNPFEELVEMKNRMDTLFNRDFTYTPLSRMIPAEFYNFEPTVECIPSETAFDIFVPVPGFTPESIQVDVQAKNIIIKGERPPLFEVEKPVGRVQGWATLKATFAINYVLPTEINAAEVKATLNNGVLHLILPIAEMARVHTVPVKVVPV